MKSKDTTATAKAAQQARQGKWAKVYVLRPGGRSIGRARMVKIG